MGARVYDIAKNRDELAYAFEGLASAADDNAIKAIAYAVIDNKGHVTLMAYVPDDKSELRAAVIELAAALADGD